MLGSGMWLPIVTVGDSPKLDRNLKENHSTGNLFHNRGTLVSPELSGRLVITQLSY